MRIRFPLVVFGAALAALVLLASCKRSSGSSGPLALFLVAFPEDQRTDLFRDQTLRFEFSIPVDPSTIDADSIQVLALPSRTPVPGLYAVSGSVVTFNPVVDEGVPNPGNLPLNPYGFAEYTSFEVVIEDQGMKTVRGAFGETLTQRFAGGFTTAEGFTPQPNAPDLLFVPFDLAVYDSTNPPYTPSNPKGTLEPDDDILSYTPIPGTPPINPMTNRADYRAEHPTNVLVQVTFSGVLDPATVRTQSGGNVALEYERTPNQWVPIAATATFSPSGKTLVLNAATPLANDSRINRYRVRFDAQSPIESRGGKPLVQQVDIWDNLQRAVIRRPVVEADLTMFTRVQAGETGPWFFFEFPIDPFITDVNASDKDIWITNDAITSGPAVTRVTQDLTACTLPANGCMLALREPLTQSTTSPNPNPNSEGPSKIQFRYNSYQHGGGTSPFVLPDAEALVDMAWAPQNTFVFAATYPKLNIVLDVSQQNSTTLGVPQGLSFTAYAANLENPPGTAVRDGSTPYELTSRTTRWQSWGFERPFMQYRRDRSIVFTAWTEVGGDIEQYFQWYSPGPIPNTRMFSPPAAVNPTHGSVGQWTYYHAQFSFRRVRSLLVTKYFRITDTGIPTVRNAMATTSSIPNTSIDIEYAGATFASYTPRMIGNQMFEEGVGTPTAQTGFSSDPRVASGHEAIAIRIRFTADPSNPTLLPLVNAVSLGYSLP